MRAANEHSSVLVLERLSDNLVLVRSDTAYEVDDQKVVVERMNLGRCVAQVSKSETLDKQVLEALVAGVRGPVFDVLESLGLVLGRS